MNVVGYWFSDKIALATSRAGQLAVSRQREYLVDATGAQLLGHAAPLAERIRRLRALDGDRAMAMAA
jgi:Zn-dependent protease with chaperone function